MTILTAQKVNNNVAIVKVGKVSMTPTNRPLIKGRLATRKERLAAGVK